MPKRWAHDAQAVGTRCPSRGDTMPKPWGHDAQAVGNMMSKPWGTLMIQLHIFWTCIKNKRCIPLLRYTLLYIFEMIYSNLMMINQFYSDD